MRRWIATALTAGLAAALIAAAPSSHAQNAPVADHLALPGPIDFRGVSYRLAWSSRPTQSYAIQEYVPEGERVEQFSTMILVSVSRDGHDVLGAARAKIADLTARKTTDPSSNFAIVKNDRTGELLLDFVLSAEPPGGELVSEWNAYRYAPYAGPGGAKGVALFGLSRRAYGAARLGFFKALKAARKADIAAFAALPAPKPVLR